MLVFALGDIRQSTVELQLPLEALWVEDLEDRDPQSSKLSPDCISFIAKQQCIYMYYSMYQ